MPPSASGLPARLVLGPALRAQSDRRLVRLVREGYESAFEEIVRRYRRPLDRFAAGIVGSHSEDVTQDSFRKALEALRHGDSDVELRPWLYRIVRNTALNDLRDRPPAAAELAEDLIGGGRSAAAEAEERAEIATLTARLRALPDNQRAALVMRELEGMSHEEIAATLGVSHGAARQAIARGRATVRSGFGALVPLPLLRALASGGDGAAEAAGAAGAAGAAVGGGAALGSGAATVGGAGALKIGLATLAVAGSIGAGVAVQHHGADRPPPEAAKLGAIAPGGRSDDGVRSIPSPVIAEVDDHGSGAEQEFGEDHGSEGSHGHGRDGGRGGSDRSDHHGSGDGLAETDGGPGPSGGGPGPSSGPSSGSGHDGSGRSGGDETASSGDGGSGGGGESRGGSDSSSSGSDSSGSSGSNGGSGSGDSGDS